MGTTYTEGRTNVENCWAKYIVFQVIIEIMKTYTKLSSLSAFKIRCSFSSQINSLVPNVTFLYPLNTSENSEDF